jgi:DNA-binding HxlR family transcriptional regulator
VIERAISNYVPRLVAVRWTYCLLELGKELFNLIDKLDALTAKTTTLPQDVTAIWLDVSHNWSGGETGLINLGNPSSHA